MAEERRPTGDARAGVQSQGKGCPLERGGKHLSWEEAPAGADTGRFGCGEGCVSSGCGSSFLQDVGGRVTREPGGGQVRVVGAEEGTNFLGVGGQPGREPQACGPLRNDRGQRTCI